MITCYTARDAQEASLLVLELNANGIDAIARPSASAMAYGDLPMDVLRVPVQVPEAQLEEARRVTTGFFDRGQQRAAGERAPWTCASCGESNEPTFEVCWSCQAEAPGAA